MFSILHKINEVKSLHVEMYYYELLVVHLLLIVISPIDVLSMNITNEQKSATMVTINLKVSMCRSRDTTINSYITKVLILVILVVILMLILLSMYIVIT